MVCFLRVYSPYLPWCSQLDASNGRFCAAPPFPKTASVRPPGFQRDQKTQRKLPGSKSPAPFLPSPDTEAWVVKAGRLVVLLGAVALLRYAVGTGGEPAATFRPTTAVRVGRSLRGWSKERGNEPDVDGDLILRRFCGEMKSNMSFLSIGFKIRAACRGNRQEHVQGSRC